jgi:acyl dehydratase
MLPSIRLSSLDMPADALLATRMDGNRLVPHHAGQSRRRVGENGANLILKGPTMPEIDGYEVLGLGLYFEDLPLGRKFRTIGRTLTKADLVAFIGVTGMTEVLFSNLEFLRQESDIKQRVVPAAMVYSFAEGLLVHATMQHTGFAFLHMELNVEGPTFADDTIHVECEVVESRRSNSRPNRGLVRTRNRVVQQDGRLVLTYTPLRMVKARSEA